MFKLSAWKPTLRKLRLTIPTDYIKKWNKKRKIQHLLGYLVNFINVNNPLLSCLYIEFSCLFTRSTMWVHWYEWKCKHKVKRLIEAWNQEQYKLAEVCQWLRCCWRSWNLHCYLKIHYNWTTQIKSEQYMVMWIKDPSQNLLLSSSYRFYCPYKFDLTYSFDGNNHKVIDIVLRIVLSHQLHN